MSRLLLAIPVSLLLLTSPASLPGAGHSPSHTIQGAPSATIWYLGHCGYAIQTANHLLIFDYIELEEEVPTEKGLDLGFVDASEIADLNVTVFVTHVHIDHYDEVILEWKQTIPSIEYVFGWEAIRGPGYHNLPDPRSHLILDDIRIWTVESQHTGDHEVAFLVHVDGLWIYHGGDYQGKSARNAPSHVDEDMALLAEQTNSVDLFFIGAWTGEPYMKSIRALHPRVIFPMHSRGQEHEYRQFAEDLAGLGVNVPVVCPEKRGDRYRFEAGSILPSSTLCLL